MTATANKPRIRLIEPELYHVYPFTARGFVRAYQEWGCNCGPSALAFALKISLDQARSAIPGFDAKRYTSPSMMRSALLNLHAVWESVRPGFDRHIYSPGIALVRIQWTGPWTAPGVTPRWKYRQSHWVASFSRSAVPYVFDCNSGVRNFNYWRHRVVPQITRNIPRADGGWYATHVWWVKGVIPYAPTTVEEVALAERKKANDL